MKNNFDFVLVLGKDLGLDLLKWFNNFYDISKVYICSKQDFELIQYCKNQNICFSIYKRREIFIENKNKKYSQKKMWLINCWSNHIFEKKTLLLFDHTINFHPSFLPLCKGSDAAAWTIIKRYKAGVTLNEISDNGVDLGDIYVRKEIKYSFPTKGIDLHKILKKELLCLFIKYWKKIINYEITAKKIKNIKKTKTYTRKMTNEDRKIDITKNFVLIKFINKVLAHDFGEISSSELILDKKKYAITMNLKRIK